MKKILILIPNAETFHDSYRFGKGIEKHFLEWDYQVKAVALDREPIPTENFDLAIGIETFIEAKLISADTKVCWAIPPTCAQGVEPWMELGFDYYAFNSAKLAKTFGGLCIFLSANLENHFPVKKDKSLRQAVVYCGHWTSPKGYENIRSFLDPLRDFDLRIYGDYWENSPFSEFWQGFADYTEQRRLYSSAGCCVHFSNPSVRPWNLVASRPYEILACNGCMVSERLPQEFDGYYVKMNVKNIRQIITSVLSGEIKPRKREGIEFLLSGNTFRDRAEQFVKLLK